MVLVLWMVHHEEVRVDVRLFLWFVPLLASSPMRFDTKVLHHASHTFLVDLEVYGESFVTVRRVLSEYLFNLNLEHPVFIGHLGAVV